MPLTLNVGLSRKVGEANFSSRGASVNLELELDSAIAEEPERLQERIRQLFHIAKGSIDEELNSAGEETPANGRRSTDVQKRHAAGQNGGHRLNANANGQRSSNRPTATSSQVRALHTIVHRQRLDLAALLQKRFNHERPDALTITEASELIDELKNNNTASAGGHR